MTNSQNSNNGIRRLLMVVLVGAVAYGGWQLKSLQDGDGFGRASLDARVSQYMQLRMANEWVAMYDLVDPLHRSVVDMKTFLQVHDHDVLELLELEARERRLDDIQQVATVNFFSKARFKPENLPPQFRAGFRMDAGDEDKLTQAAEHELAWVWRDGQWYFQLDRELLTRKDPSSGEPIQLFDRVGG